MLRTSLVFVCLWKHCVLTKAMKFVAYNARSAFYKVFGTFHLSPIGELVGYNEKFQPQEVVIEVVRKVVGDSSCV